MNVDITDLKTVRLSQDGSAVIIMDQTHFMNAAHSDHKKFIQIVRKYL